MEKENEIICYCRNVSRAEIESAIQAGAKTLQDIQRMTSACIGNLCSDLNPKGVCCFVDIIPMLPKDSGKCSCCCG
ncbi:MAG TPA: NAD(P)H-nitrite reductase [Prolixibacteraceae bacterium]|nr:NAD(P)H-nitrite reductase [Prolixibacteraceae bacterium]HCU61497.1 NAD(P)H-nitrite reductase [Prolixibacteraceae bacterium]